MQENANKDFSSLSLSAPLSLSFSLSTESCHFLFVVDVVVVIVVVVFFIFIIEEGKVDTGWTLKAVYCKSQNTVLFRFLFCYLCP